MLGECVLGHECVCVRALVVVYVCARRAREGVRVCASVRVRVCMSVCVRVSCALQKKVPVGEVAGVHLVIHSVDVVFVVRLEALRPVFVCGCGYVRVGGCVHACLSVCARARAWVYVYVRVCAPVHTGACGVRHGKALSARGVGEERKGAVSYTHLTLPTIA